MLTMKPRGWPELSRIYLQSYLSSIGLLAGYSMELTLFLIEFLF